MKIGFLHPGEMGISLAASAINSGHEACWSRAGRSAATQARAQQQGLTALDSLHALCDACSVLISVCPPHAALQQAQAVIDCGFKGIYTDVNAISPSRVRQMGAMMRQAGIPFVDGGVIGPPAWQADTTWLYLAGERADEVATGFQSGPLETEILSGEIGRASALKMCFAAKTKGTTALLAAVLGAAEQMGVRQALETQWDRYNPGESEQTHTRLRTVARKAWRFTGEMQEIASTFEAAGLPPDFHHGAGAVYARQARFKDDTNPPLEDILQALLEDGKQSY